MQFLTNFNVYSLPGVFDVKSQPAYNFPNFVSGSKEIELEYASSCCYPEVTITVRDMDNNLGVCIIKNGDLESNIEGELQCSILKAHVHS